MFALNIKGSNFKTELLAGLTTFMTMVYILAVHPAMLAKTGMDQGAVFTATVISAIIGTVLIGLLTNLPFAMAPGMGLNAFFTYTVVLGMGYSWETALTAILIEGILFILLTLLNIREAIINSLPINLKHAISVGIGLFIALIGLKDAGLIQANEDTLVSLGNLALPHAWIALTGLLIMSVFLVKKLKGALLYGIIGATILALLLKESALPSGNWIAMPPSLKPIAFKIRFDEMLHPEILLVLFTFLFVDMFDTVGTLIGVSSKANLLDKNGQVPKAKQALLADSIATSTGALLGTSTVTTYMESAAGISVGGKTGYTSLFVAFAFLLALFLSPVFLMIPDSATAPALIMVGLFMMSPIKKIELNEYAEGIPAFLTIIMMPLAHSISEGIFFGVICYVLIKTLTFKLKELSWPLVILSVFFIARLVFQAMSATN